MQNLNQCIQSKTWGSVLFGRRGASSLLLDVNKDPGVLAAAFTRRETSLRPKVRQAGVWVWENTDLLMGSPDKTENLGSKSAFQLAPPWDKFPGIYTIIDVDFLLRNCETL